MCRLIKRGAATHNSCALVYAALGHLGYETVSKGGRLYNQVGRKMASCGIGEQRWKHDHNVACLW
eukprot:756878-Pelagomonas_calceolata.AAC.1